MTFPNSNAISQYMSQSISQTLPNDTDKLSIDLDILEKYNSIKAVYFLVFENQVVYVGQTKNLLSRILGHLKDRQKVFDSIFYIETQEENLMILEKSNIENIKPIYNKFGVTKAYPKTKTFIDNLQQQNEFEKVFLTCLKCGKPFYGASHARYCSDACKMKAYRKRKKRDDKKDTSGNRICAHCGTPFTGALYARYCSNAHKQAAHRMRKKQKTFLEYSDVSN